MGRRKKVDEFEAETETETIPAEPIDAPAEVPETTIVMDDAPVAMPVPKEEPAATVPKETDQTLVKVFKNSPRTTVPTLISYKPAGASVYKHVIVDICLASIEEGWRVYKAMHPNGSPENYLLEVYAITRSEIPRMYRAVAVTSLD